MRWCKLPQNNADVNKSVKEFVVDDVRNGNGDDKNEVDNRVDDNVKDENRNDEEFDVKDAVNLLDVDEVVVNGEVVSDVVDVENEKFEDEVCVN